MLRKEFVEMADERAIFDRHRREKLQCTTPVPTEASALWHACLA